MAYNHEYPYVDPSRYNDDWLINKVKELAAEWSKVQQAWNTEQEAFKSLKAFVNNYFDNLDVQQEINNKLDAMAQDGSLYEIIKKYTDPIITDQNNKITVLERRMDSFTNLPTGSTSGDAELADIRVGYNGVTYPTAGDAVRGQASELSSEINNIGDILFGDILLWEAQFVYGGYIGSTDFNTQGNWGKCKTARNNTLSLENNFTIRLDMSDKTYRLLLSVIDSNNRYLGMYTGGDDLGLPIINNVYTVNINDIKKTYPQAARTYITIANREGQSYLTVPNNLRITVYNGKYLIDDVNESIKFAETLYTDNFPFTRLSDVEKNRMYYFLLPSIPTDAPSGFVANERYYLFTTGMIFRFNNSIQGTQYLWSTDLRKRWSRNYINNDFEEWVQFDNEKMFTVNKNGGSDYTSLLECLLDAVKTPNSKVFVNEGIYDVYQEFIDYYGSSFFDDFTFVYNGNNGYVLNNGIEVTFSNKATVTFNYNGGNKQVYRFFAPFNMGYGSATLKNATIIAKNCRYCVHDDIGGYQPYYCHKYINCHMEMDNTGNPHQDTRQCIGGGLGYDGHIVVDGCYFDSVGMYADALHNMLASWHNNGESNSKSFGIVKNCYFNGIGTFRVGCYGQSQLISEFIVCGNRLGSEPKHIFENDVNAPYDNIKLIAFNNQIGD